MGYYNRIHYGRELNELDSAMQRAMVDLNLQVDMVRFLMAIDADTRVDTMSITHMGKYLKTSSVDIFVPNLTALIPA